MNIVIIYSTRHGVTFFLIIVNRTIYIYPEIDIKLFDFVLFNVISVKDSKSTSLLALSTNLNRNNTEVRCENLFQSQ